MSAYIRWLIAQKRQWHHPSDPKQQQSGFRGWHTRGYLPHFDVPGVTQMIGFRLGDALPLDRQEEWEPIVGLKEERERRVRLEEYFDQGHGACELAVPEVAHCLENALFHGDDRFYRLLAWVIMPNHVHVLVEIWTRPMSQLVKAWKRVATSFVNRHFQREGELWQADYFDRYIRDEAHFHKAVHYIERNPVMAGLVKEPKDWQWGSAKWRPEGFGLEPVQRPIPPTGGPSE
jgi:REP element-mobilizing transposase RayT